MSDYIWVRLLRLHYVLVGDVQDYFESGGMELDRGDLMAFLETLTDDEIFQVIRATKNHRWRKVMGEG